MTRKSNEESQVPLPKGKSPTCEIESEEELRQKLYHLEEVGKECMEELEREKDLSGAIINSLPGVFYLFDETGRFIKWNRNFDFKQCLV